MMENAVQNASQSVVVQDDMDENVLSSETASTSGVGMLNQRMESTVEGLLEDENKVEMRDEDTFSQMSGFSETGSQMEDSVMPQKKKGYFVFVSTVQRDLFIL